MKYALASIGIFAGLMSTMFWIDVAMTETKAGAENTMGKTTTNHEIATFAGGCFWCMEPPFDKLDGVISTTSGFTGGPEKNPSYEDVAYGRTGHAESVQVVYDPSKVSYEKLLEVFWHNIDPFQKEGQFCDRGKQYRTAIFYHGEKQKELAEKSKAALESSGKFGAPLVTEIVEASEFYPAEGYHQDYYLKNPTHYKMYRLGCGRDRRLNEIWGNK